MTLPGSSDPRAFGDAIRQLRESKAVPLERIVERTKISRRMLESLEEGNFERLPGPTFGRMFLKQYLDLLGEPPEPWLAAFAAAWRRHEAASDTFPALTDEPPVRRPRLTPWLLGVLLVAASFVAFALLQRRREPHPPAPAPTSEALLAMVTPPPVPTVAPTAAATPAPTAAPLVISTGGRPCWVEVHEAGRPPQVRLLSPGESWGVAVGDGPVDLVLGDAGTAHVTFRGRDLGGLGSSGEVVHLHLPPAAPATPAKPNP